MTSRVYLHPGMTLAQAARIAGENNCALANHNGVLVMVPFDSPEPTFMSARALQHKKLLRSIERFEKTRNQGSPTHDRNVLDDRFSCPVARLRDHLID